MMAGLAVLLHRRLPWRGIFSSNPLLVCFLAYCLVSMAWSDFPFIAFKRWFKGLGDPLIALILLSESNPAAAVASVLRRCAFVLIPLSIVFIKYFPYLGRGYDDWTGLAFYTGVTTNKNMLGYLLLVFGLLFLCTLFTRDRATARTTRRGDVALSVLFLGMIAWLCQLANSQTSLVALCAAGLVVLSLGSTVVRKYVGGVALVALVVGVGLQWAFDITGSVLRSIGRDATLTGRTEVWDAVIALAPHPFVGAGFQSFWLGDRLQAMWAKFPVFRPNQAHNGYIEIYLNLGLIGLVIFGALLVAFYRTIRRKLDQAVAAMPTSASDLILAKFGIGYFAAYLLYNVTEAIFQPLNFLFIVLLVLGIRYPLRATPRPVASPVGRFPLWARAIPPPESAGVAAIGNVQHWRRPATSSGNPTRIWGMPREPAQPGSGARGMSNEAKNPSVEGERPKRGTGRTWVPPSRPGDKFSW